jgi:hypothetical protein
LINDQGVIKDFIQNNEFESILGLKIYNNKIYVAVGNAGFTNPNTAGQTAFLFMYNLDGTMFKKIALHDYFTSQSGYFANDITFSEDGTIYVTDSFASVIYVLDKDYAVSVITNDFFKAGDGFNLNGIVYQNGYLLVAKTNTGELFKVTNLKTTPVVEKISVDKLDNIDGLLSVGSALYATKNGSNQVVKLLSDDIWKSAKVANLYSGFKFPTSLTTRKNNVYVLNSSLDKLLTSVSEEQFSIVKIQ